MKLRKKFEALPLLRRSPLLSPCARKNMDMDALQKSIAAAMQSALKPVLKRLDKLEDSASASPLIAQKPENVAQKVAQKQEQKQKRLPTPKATDELRKLVRDTIMELIDAALLAPEHATELFPAKMYLGKTIGQYTLNKTFFLVIVNHVLDEHNTDATTENVKILHDLVVKRRQYHQRSWKVKKECKNLKYGGQLGVMSPKLVALYNQSLSKATGKTQKAKKNKKRNHKGTPKKETPKKK